MRVDPFEESLYSVKINDCHEDCRSRTRPESCFVTLVLSITHGLRTVVIDDLLIHLEEWLEVRESVSWDSFAGDSNTYILRFPI